MGKHWREDRLEEGILQREHLQSPEGRALWDKYFRGKFQRNFQGNLQESNMQVQETYAPSHLGTYAAPHNSTYQKTPGRFQPKQGTPSFPEPDLIAPQTIAPQTFPAYIPAHAVPVTSALPPCSLYDVLSYFKSQGVVGEENLLATMTLALIGRCPLGVEGYSGSGKTFITRKLLELVPERVYKIGLSSNLAVFYDQDRINQKEILFIPELQKAMKKKDSPIVEVIKDLTEGADATRVVTDKERRDVARYKINKGRTVIYTLALENDFKKDVETGRRFLRVQTDSSPEHLEDILRQKSEQRYLPRKEEKEQRRLQYKVKQHINSCLDLDVRTIDPFAGYISSIMPRTQKAASYIDHYYSLLDACGKFHHQERIRVTLKDGDYILLGLDDHIQVHQAYYSQFLNSLGDLHADGKLPVRQPDWDECLQAGMDIVEEAAVLEVLRESCPQQVSLWKKRQWERAGRMEREVERKMECHNHAGGNKNGDE